MAEIENLVRDSLRQRAQEVESTPELWQEVDRRVSRRRRGRVLRWSLAGATAVLAGVAVLPTLLAGPGPSLQIDPMDLAPSGGIVPDAAVIVDGEELVLLDLASGRTQMQSRQVGREIVQLAVRPGSTSTQQDLAMVSYDEGDDLPYSITRLVVSASSTSLRGLWMEPADEGFVPTVAWAPTGGAFLFSATAPSGDRLLVVPEGALLGADEEMQLGEVPRGSQVLDWIGASSEPGDVSVLVLRRPDGELSAFEVTVSAQGPWAMAPLDDPLETGDNRVLDLASSHAVPGSLDEPIHVLREVDGQRSVMWMPPDGSLADLEHGIVVDDLVGDADPEDLWIDAKGDVVLLGDGETVWLLAHDGRGEFVEPTELATSPLARLLDVSREVVAVPPQPEPPVDPEAPSDDDPGPGVTDPDPDTAPVEDPAVEPTPGAVPLLVADGREIRLLEDGSSAIVLEMDPEGESSILGLAVRPGSTREDYTAVVLTTAEGMDDLRHLHVVDGEVVTWEPFGGAYAPGAQSSAAARVRGRPMWSPDGDSLAWLEDGASSPVLRTIGWDDGPGTGEPATDGASFPFELVLDVDDGLEPPVGAPDASILRAEAWIEQPTVTETAIVVAEELMVAEEVVAGRWWVLPLHRQADGAWSQPSGRSSIEIIVDGPSGPNAEPHIIALGWAPGGDGQPWSVWLDGGRATLEDPGGRTVELPDDLVAVDGLPEIWIHPVGGEVVVGNPLTSVGYHLGADGQVTRLPGAVSHASPVR